MILLKSVTITKKKNRNKKCDGPPSSLPPSRRLTPPRQNIDQSHLATDDDVAITNRSTCAFRPNPSLRSLHAFQLLPRQGPPPFSCNRFLSILLLLPKTFPIRHFGFVEILKACRSARWVDTGNGRRGRYLHAMATEQRCCTGLMDVGGLRSSSLLVLFFFFLDHDLLFILLFLGLWMN